MVLQQEPKVEQQMETHDNDVMMSESTGMLIRPPPLVQEVVKTGQHTTNRITDKSFPSRILSMFLTEYKTGDGMYDAVWQCQGGMVFRVHRLVLASVSPLLRHCLLEQSDLATKAVIHTPELTSSCVKSLLCLFYTGKVNVSGSHVSEVNSALQMLAFQGDKVSLVPATMEEDFCQAAIVEGSNNNDDGSDEDWDPKTAFDDDIQGDDNVEDGSDWWQPSDKKQRVVSVEEPQRSYPGFRRGRKSLKTPDTDEVYRTRGPGKGDRSYQLSQDLFNGRSVDFIHVCHICYK